MAALAFSPDIGLVGLCGCLAYNFAVQGGSHPSMMVAPCLNASNQIIGNLLFKVIVV